MGARVSTNDDAIVGDFELLVDVEDVDLLRFFLFGKKGRCSGELFGIDDGSPRGLVLWMYG